MRQNEIDQVKATAISRIIHHLRQRPEVTRRSLIAVCLAACIPGLTWGVSAISRRPAKNTVASTSANTGEPASPMPAQSGPEGEIRSELVTVFPYGFEPKEITRRAGVFILSVDNRADPEGLS